MPGLCFKCIPLPNSLKCKAPGYLKSHWGPRNRHNLLQYAFSVWPPTLASHGPPGGERDCNLQYKLSLSQGSIKPALSEKSQELQLLLDFHKVRRGRRRRFFTWQLFQDGLYHFISFKYYLLRLQEEQHHWLKSWSRPLSIIPLPKEILFVCCHFINKTFLL